ncbi:hypothetical protein TNCV_2460781 [Trichonephila clavipes]|nr:hypothetical protein TNCV_2460781 [Trichonephila clavipes]
MTDPRLSVQETAKQVEISTGSSHAVLYDHGQSGCEIFSQASVGGKEKLCLQVLQDLLDTIDDKPGFLQLLAVLKNENATDRVPCSE